MANEEQAVFWTETAGPVWVANEAFLVESARPFGRAALEAASVAPGERVVDVGCGTGPTTVELARRVTDGGRVLAVDISPLMLARARERVTEEGLPNVELVEADAQTHPFEPQARDLVFSQFGVMFFADPVAAFANMRTATKRGGRLTFACWQDVFSNAWMSLPTIAGASILGGFDLPPEGSPGPFRYADRDLARSTLGDAGWDGIEIEPFVTTMDIAAEDLADRASFMLQMGPLKDAFTESPDDIKRKAIDAIVEAASEHGSDGSYRLPAAAWIVTARA